MSADYVYLNGSLVLRAEARISPLDRGFLYGDGFFETMRVVNSRPFRLERHLERMNRSCLETGWGRGVDTREVERAVGELALKNGVRDGYLRVSVSRGTYDGSLTPLEAREPTILIDVHTAQLPPLEEPPPFVLARSPYLRHEAWPLVRHKTLSYQGNVLALAEGRRRGADEVFFLNSRGCLTEGAITNLFVVRNGRVLTPDVACGLLPGITREAVIELCDELGIPHETGEYGESDLETAEEVFCTNSLRGIVGVRAVLEYPGKPLSQHSLTRRLQIAYAEMVKAECGEQA
jgi:branched-subunit amino acid aminotransferase/4-amino-4-deoxychorismate lyase